jgi:iron complex transport system ATP-binding protein
MSDRMIGVKDLSFEYTHGLPVFENVNLSLNRGEILVLLGPNGAGKTTLLNCISGLLHPKSGEITIDGADTRTMSVRETAKLLGYLPQIHSAQYEFTVIDYLVMGRAPYLKFGAAPGKAEYEKAGEVMARIGISYLAEKSCNTISGGELQQAQLGRVLMQETKIILLDEPTNHLDYGNQIKILRLIHALAQKGYSVLMTSHVPDHAIMLGCRVGVLERDGAFVLGDADEVLTETRLSALYETDIRIGKVIGLDRSVCVPGDIFGTLDI